MGNKGIFRAAEQITLSAAIPDGENTMIALSDTQNNNLPIVFLGPEAVDDATVIKVLKLIYKSH